MKGSEICTFEGTEICTSGLLLLYYERLIGVLGLHFLPMKGAEICTFEGTEICTFWLLLLTTTVVVSSSNQKVHISVPSNVHISAPFMGKKCRPKTPISLSFYSSSNPNVHISVPSNVHISDPFMGKKCRPKMPKSYRCPKFDGDAKQSLEIRVER